MFLVSLVLSNLTNYGRTIHQLSCFVGHPVCPWFRVRYNLSFCFPILSGNKYLNYSRSKGFKT